MGFRSFLHRMTAPKMTKPVENLPIKLVLVINHSLGMKKGKIAAQVGHASVQTVLSAGSVIPHIVDAWLGQGQKKVCVKATDEQQMNDLSSKASQANIHTSKTIDAGHTQIPKGSYTVLAIGPWYEAEIDEITGHLSLL
jgi:PTH2 family peptidyl-tRNA hydrolase